MGMGTKAAGASSRAVAGQQVRNKKKRATKQPAPVVIAHECPSAMRAHVVEVPAGRDVLSCVAQLARRGRRGALVLGAAGRVTDVVLREPALLLRGTTEILGLSGCFLPPSSSAAAAVFLAGPRGSVLGGSVAVGGLVAAGPVVVMVATFVAAALDRLPLLKDVDGHGQPLQQQLCWKLGAKKR